MKAWAWGVFKATVFSAIGGGLLLWLQANGIDLPKQVAAGLKIAQSPENRLLTLIVLSAVIGVCILAVGVGALQFVRARNRPPLATAKALREALISVNEEVFDAFPDDVRATRSLEKLRAVLFDVTPYATISKQVRSILVIADRYLVQAISGASDSETEVASLYDQAKQEIRELLQVTNWTVRGQS